MSFGKTSIKSVVLAFAVAALAFGDVLVDRSGVGSVGKGDVQSSFGWNDGLLQRHAGEVHFEHQAEQVYRAVCTHVKADGTTADETHYFTQVTTRPIISEVVRNKKQKVTGFLLHGIDRKAPPEVEGNVPNVGEKCSIEGTPGTWTSVEPDGAARITIKICFRDFCITIIIDL